MEHGKACRVAAEKTSRQAWLVKLDPAYCDVVVQPWQRFSGRSAILDGDGRAYNEIAAASWTVTDSVSKPGSATGPPSSAS